MSTPNCETTVKLNEHSRQNTDSYTLFWKVPKSLQTFWGILTWDTSANLKDLLSQISQESMAKRKELSEKRNADAMAKLNMIPIITKKSSTTALPTYSWPIGLSTENNKDC